MAAVTVDFLFPANHVEVINGLIYTHGGGWTDIFVNPAPGGAIPPTPLGIVVGLTVPWTELGRPHDVAIRIEPTDGTEAQEPTVVANAQIIAQQPIHLPPDTPQHAMLGVSVLAVFPRGGTYRLVAFTDNATDSKVWDFRVNMMGG